MPDNNDNLEMPVARNLSVDELIEFYDKIIEEVDEDLAEKGITARLSKPSTPDGLEGHVEWAANGDPVAPSDVTELPPLQLGQLYSFMNSWTNYVSSELVRARNTLLLQDRVMKVITAALKTYYREERSIAESKVSDAVLTDKRFVAEDSDLLKIKVFVASLDARHDQLKRTCNHVSREQTRRQQEFERGNRDGSDGGYTPDSPKKNRGKKKPQGGRTGFRRHR